jgi:quinoprotein glucose dehydrogenase
MGPYYIPAQPGDGTAKSGLECSWYAPGASGGVNIDGGAAVDPETGLLYVGAQTGLGTIEVVKDPCSEFRYSSPHDSCGQLGALPPPPGYKKPEGRGGRGGGGAGAGAGAGGGRGGGTMLGGVWIAKPKELGGVTAYNMSTGDKSWWIPNGGELLPVESKDPLFAGVKLPPMAPRQGHAQVITTKSLVIYGTGRSGGPPITATSPPRIFAVDKATGKQVGAVTIPSRTSAVPMTFMHKGRQYIVFATGGGTNASLVALALPRAAATTSQ